MSIPRLEAQTYVSDKLNLLAAIVKTRSRANLTDANKILEEIMARVLNCLFGWDLSNLNSEELNFPAVDLGDTRRKLAVQVTNMEGSEKIKRTLLRAKEHNLGRRFSRLIILFLLHRKPRLPRDLELPAVEVDTWDLTDLLRSMQGMELKALEAAANVLKEELPEELNKIDRRKPKLMARFQEDDDGICVAGKEDGLSSYCFDLWVDGAPEETKDVRFEILYNDVTDPKWKVSRGDEAREFLTDEEFNAYGDFVICARGRGPGAGNWFHQSTLYEALVRYHGKKPKDPEVRTALKQIRDN